MNPTAATLLYILAADGRMPLNALADAMGTTANGIRYSLTELRRAGLVDTELQAGATERGDVARFYWPTAAGAALARAEQVPA